MISIELFFLINAAMDAWLLFNALKWLDAGRPRPARIAAASLAGALYASLAWSGLARWLLAPPVMLAAALGMSRIALGKSAPLAAIKCVGFFIGAAFLTGGSAYALNSALPNAPFPAVMSASVAVSGAAAWALGRNKKRARWEYGRVTLQYRGAGFSIEAAVDSGNHAIEPISGLPVVVVPQESLAALFRDAGAVGLPEGMRLMTLSTAAGSALAPCFTPDIIAWNGNIVRAAVAVVPRSRVPVALAPSSFAGTAQSGRRLA